MPDIPGEKLLKYLDTYGILTCNRNLHLPSLEDIGCSWLDATTLIDAHELFYCKVYRKRTTYLSKEAYFLLKECRTPKHPSDNAQKIYDFLDDNPPIDTDLLKQMVGMSPRDYSNAFNYLLENMMITAIQNGRVLQANWSTFLYSTAVAWERHVHVPARPQQAKEKLWSIFSRTMAEKDFQRLIKQ